MERKIGLSSARARASASGPQGYQSTGLSLCWRRYGDDSSARRLATSGGYRRLRAGGGARRGLAGGAHREIAEALEPGDAHPPLLRLGRDRDLVVLVADRDEVAGVELVEPPDDVSRRDRMVVRKDLDESAGHADVNVAVPVVADVDEDRVAVLAHFDRGVVVLDHAGLVRTALVRGVEQLPR